MGWQLFRHRGPATTNPLVEGSALQAGGDDAFWASPVGRAAHARLRGDRFFQIELDDEALAAYAETAAHQQHDEGRRARRTCDLLGQIEELGWHLEHVSWWRVDDFGATGDGGTAGSAVLTTPDPGSEHVRGVYLFHAVDVDGQHAAAHAAAAPPSHRRDVAP
jgi:hypothetical protein